MESHKIRLQFEITASKEKEKEKSGKRKYAVSSNSPIIALHIIAFTDNPIAT
jgi:hypothetical protein